MSRRGEEAVQKKSRAGGRLGSGVARQGRRVAMAANGEVIFFKVSRMRLWQTKETGGR